MCATLRTPLSEVLDMDEREFAVWWAEVAWLRRGGD